MKTKLGYDMSDEECRAAYKHWQRMIDKKGLARIKEVYQDALFLTGIPEKYLSTLKAAIDKAKEEE